MSNKYTKYLLIIALSSILGSGLFAQPKDNSPFSQFGLGDFIENSTPTSHGMGGLGSVYHDFFEANYDNPASLGFLQYTSLQVGFYIKKSVFERINEKQNVWSGNLDHLSLNIPLINPLNEALERRESKFSWGTGISLRPYSQVGYHVQLQDEIDSIGQVQRDFKGEGGIYQFTWAHGLKYKNLSAGINLAYFYGQQSFNEEISFQDLENPYIDIFETSIAYKGFQYRLGLMYEHPLDLEAAREKEDDPSRFVSAGFFYSGKSNLDASSDITKLAFNPRINTIDTALLLTNVAADTRIPSSWGAGMMYRHAGDFRVGIDYQSASWSQYINEARPDTLKDARRFAAGAAWIPDANSITSYFKRVEYRAGFYTLTDPRVIEGEQVKETAFTLGALMPLIRQRNIAWFQFSLDIGKRTGGERLSDNFVRGKIGLIFNDNSWFIRGKYH
jgi:hypothetical protein